MTQPYNATTYYYWLSDETQKEIDSYNKLMGEKGYCRLHNPFVLAAFETSLNQFFYAGFRRSSIEVNGEEHPEKYHITFLEPEFAKLFPRIKSDTDFGEEVAVTLWRAVAERMFMHGFESSTKEINNETFDKEKHQTTLDYFFNTQLMFTIGVQDQEGYDYKMNKRNEQLATLKEKGVIND